MDYQYVFGLLIGVTGTGLFIGFISAIKDTDNKKAEKFIQCLSRDQRIVFHLNDLLSDKDKLLELIKSMTNDQISIYHSMSDHQLNIAKKIIKRELDLYFNS